MNDTEDSLTAGLRAMESLARHGPLDLPRLARMNGWRIERAAALVTALESDGWVRRLDGPAGFAATARAAALVGATRAWVH